MRDQPGASPADSRRRPRPGAMEQLAWAHASYVTEFGHDGEIDMLWGLVVLLVVLWALGFLAFHIGGGLIHLLLVIAVIVIIYNVIRGRGVRL